MLAREMRSVWYKLNITRTRRYALTRASGEVPFPSGDSEIILSDGYA